jgi:KDO2-lipid IV(A) lauroyltransferase
MKRIIHTLLDRMVFGLAWLLSLLPLSVLYAFSSCLSRVVVHRRLYRYKVVERNIAMAFPERSAEARHQILVGFYRHLADSLVESLKMLSESNDSLRRRVEHFGFEQLQADADAQRPVVLYLGHYANWEVVPTITWVIPQAFTCAQIYKPAHKVTVGDSIVHRIRNRFGALNIPQKQAFRTLLSLQRAGKLTITGFIADQRPNGKFSHWTEFLGLPTAYVVGGEEIGRRIGAAYYYLDIRCPYRGHTVLTLQRLDPELGEDYPYTVSYLRRLEQTIHRDPALWLWSHKRWAGQENYKLEN